MEVKAKQRISASKAGKRVSKFLKDGEATKGLPPSVLHHLQILESALVEGKPKKQRSGDTL